MEAAHWEAAPAAEASEEEVLWEALGRRALWVALVGVEVGDGEVARNISNFPGGAGMRFPGGAGISPAVAVPKDVAPEIGVFRKAFPGSGTHKRG